MAGQGSLAWLPILLLAPLAAATVPEMPLPVPTVGDRWEYETTGGGAYDSGERREVEVVAVDASTFTTRARGWHADSGEERFAFTTTIQRGDGAFVRVEMSVPTSGGRSNSTHAYSPPCKRLDYPLRVGDARDASCRVETRSGGPDGLESTTERVETGRSVVSGVESIETPAGAFVAFVVEQHVGGRLVGRAWHAPDACGPVALDAIAEDGRTQQRERLSAFSCASPGDALGPEAIQTAGADRKAIRGSAVLAALALACAGLLARRRA